MQLRLSRSFFPWIAYHFKEFFLWYTGAFISLYILQKLQLELPLRVREVTSHPESISPNLAWVFILIAIGVLIFRTLSRLLFFYPARVQQKLLRSEIIQALENTNPNQYQKFAGGQVYQILFNDINRLRGFVGFALLQLGNVIIATWVLLPELLKFQKELWVAFLPLILGLVAFIIVSGLLQKFSKQASFAQGEVQNYLMEVYSAKSTIKNYHYESSFIKQFIELVNTELSAFFKISIGYSFSIPLIRLGLGFSLLMGAAILTRHGKGASEIIFFSGFLFLILEPLMFFSWMSIVTSEGVSAWRRIKELWVVLDSQEQEQKISHPEEIKCKIPYWDFQLDLNFKKNKWSIFCGSTGCGKSELLKKISSSLKTQNISLSMVQQDPFLFNDTIAANIFLGEPVSDEEALTLLDIFGLNDLAPKAELLNLVIGENGKRLSGGERKRVALIRSLISKAEVILWDDPFSSVDIVQERKILKILKEKYKNKTFILTSHRWTTVREVDWLYFFNKEEGIVFQETPEKALFDDMIKAFFHAQLV